MNELGATVLGVSHDTVESHEAFAKSLSLGFPLVADPEKRITTAYGVKGFFGGPRRVSFVIDAQNVIRHVYASSSDIDGHVKKSMDAVRKLVEKTA